MASLSQQSGDDRWVRTHCQMCYSNCPIRVCVRDGVATRIEGDPTYHLTQGRICARGRAGLMKLYDPRRIKAPLIRTNPSKGRGVDPAWRQATWEEALQLVGDRLAAIRRDNPHKLMAGLWPFEKFIPAYTWCHAFGTENGVHVFTGVGSHCAVAMHLVGNFTHGAQAEFPDIDHCRYLMVLGCGIGSTAFNNLVYFAQRLADARQRGMRLVVVDPRLSPLAAKADEWVPIIPGTDLSLLLAMLHVLLNEEGLYDADFLRWSTNTPYLVDAEGRLVRDEDSGKPLLWDEASSRPRRYDDADLGLPALQGDYLVHGIRCRPAFEVMKRRFAEHPPERAADVTGVPAETIRRLAREFGQAARLGSTIELAGATYPYRPVSAISYRGMEAHANGTLAMMALETMNAVVGCLDAVGGTLARSGDERRYGCTPPPLTPGEDGLPIARIPGHVLYSETSFPPRTFNLNELYPLSMDPGHLAPPVILDLKRYGIEVEPEALLLYHVNPVMSLGDPEVVMRSLEKLFVVDITLYMDETAEFADVILPESSFLERYNLANLESDGVGLLAAQPVVEPMYDCREGMDILIDLADRSGCLRGPGGYNALLNGLLHLCPSHRLDVDGRHAWVDILDRWARCRFGEDHGLAWFQEHGHVMRQRTPAEKYRPGRWAGLRVPVYFTFMREVGDRLRDALDRSGYESTLGFRWDTSDYVATPFWKPSPLHREKMPFDLYCINYKTSTTTSADTVTNPWLAEINRADTPYLHVEIHPEAARARGIRSGDRVRIESRVGSVEGIAVLTEGIQPQTVGIAAIFGRWMDHPVARAGGAHHNALLPLTIEHTDKISGAIEACARVRVTRV